MNIGSHTLNHLRLIQISVKLQIDELQESKRYLEKLLNREISLLSFQYGDFNNNLVQRDKESDY